MVRVALAGGEGTRRLVTHNTEHTTHRTNKLISPLCSLFDAGDLQSSVSDQRVVDEVLKSVETDDLSSEDSRVSQCLNFLVKIEDNGSTSSEVH